MKKWILFVFIAVMITACNHKETRKGNAQMNEEMDKKNIKDESSTQQESNPQQQESNTNLTDAEKATNSKKDYEEISQKAAKKIMDSGMECIVVDVRSEPEYEAGHIEDAVLLPVDEVNENATGILPDKEALILVYCRSGVRSKHAASTLVELGYTNVKEFGGIIEWPYDIVRY